MTQGSQRTPDGTLIYRWWVYTKYGGKRYVTWAATKELAAVKAEARGLLVAEIRPAPSA